MEVHIEETSSGATYTVVVGTEDTVRCLRAKVAAATSAPSCHTHPPSSLPDAPPPPLPHLLLHGTPLGDDDTPISTTRLCSGDRLTADVSPMEVEEEEAACTWKHPARYEAGGGLMAMSPCGRYCVHTVVGCGVHIVDLVAGESVEVVSGERSNVITALGVTEHHIVYGMSRTEVAVVDRRTHLTLQSLHCDSAVTALSATSDGVFVVVSCYAGICVFNILTAECVRKKRGYGHIATVSPCNRWIASCDRLLDFETLEQIRRFGVSIRESTRAPVFSPEGDVVAIPRGNFVDVFATRDGTHLHCTRHANVISAVTFSADGEYLFTASFDSRVMASNLTTHAYVRTLFFSHRTSLWGLAISHDMQVALILDMQSIHVVSKTSYTRGHRVDANRSSQASSSVCPCC